MSVLLVDSGGDARVVRRALLSAALQECSNLHVVLLSRGRGAAEASAALVASTLRVLDQPKVASRAAQASFEMRARWQPAEASETRLLGRLYVEIGDWFRMMGESYPVEDDADRFFVEGTFFARAIGYLAEGVRLLAMAEERRGLSLAHVRARYEAIRGAVSVELSAFACAEYENLRLEAERAGERNVYLGLLGHRYRERRVDHGLLLERDDAGSIALPNPEFVATIDADSVLLSGFLPRLTEALERDAGLGVAEAPRELMPGPSSPFERMLGQTFGMGTNAVFRLRALRDSAAASRARDGIAAPCFVDERTPSSLAACGWRTFRDGEQLVYSGTRPSVGTATMRMRAWANVGGTLARRWGERFVRNARATVPAIVARVATAMCDEREPKREHHYAAVHPA